MEESNQKRPKLVGSLFVAVLLVIAMGAILNACVMPTVMSPEDATVVAEVNDDVEATVEAAIALAVKATLTSVAINGDDSLEEGAAIEGAESAGSEGTGREVATVSDGEMMTETTEVIEPVADVDPPVLITPTPDRSGEIMDIIAQNTRHFLGDPDAPVVIVEFSDFL